MVRAVLGEAGVDAGGLWIDDRQQGWALRVGDVHREMLRDEAERVQRIGSGRMVRFGGAPSKLLRRIFGIHFRKEF